MEHQKKLLNLLNETNDSRFVTKKWNMSMINQTQIMVYEIKLSKI